MKRPSLIEWLIFLAIVGILPAIFIDSVMCSWFGKCGF